jgi:hypothetical protein
MYQTTVHSHQSKTAHLDKKIILNLATALQFHFPIGTVNLILFHAVKF